LPLTVKVTVSLGTDVPVKVVTVTVKVSVLDPEATRVGDAADTVTRFCGAVWVMAMVVLAPDPASVAVMVQVPIVVFTV
jgi:hypothetical protein